MILLIKQLLFLFNLAKIPIQRIQLTQALSHETALNAAEF